MMKLNFTIFIIFVAAVCASSAIAQQNVSPEKKALIQEIRELIGVKNYRVKQEISSTDIGNVLLSIIEKDKELTDEQKQELKKAAFEAKERLEKQVRDFMADETLSAQLYDEVSVQIFDTNFTESELQEMVVFYRTPTGQKAGKFLLTLNGKVSKAFAGAFSQKFKAFASSKLQVEVDLLMQKINETKGKKLEA